jgi:LysR family transcriptional regulator for metE and metH
VVIEVRHLRIVEAVNREGSVSRAAAQLHLTQPAVSHALRDLEDRLGVTLFERQPRRMVATAEGLRVLESAGRVLDELRGLEHELAEFRDGGRGLIRLATGCYTCYYWLPRLLASFGEAWPGVDVELRPETTADPLAALLEGRLDVAIVQEPVDDPRLESDPLFEDELVVVTAPGHPFARRRYVEAAHFQDEVVIIHSRPETTYLIRDVLNPAGIAPRRLLQLQLTQAVIESVAAGLGVSTLARWVVEPQLQAGRLAAVRLGRSGVRREWRAVWSRGRRRTRPLAELISLLKREAFGVAECCAPPAGAVGSETL